MSTKRVFALPEFDHGCQPTTLSPRILTDLPRAESTECGLRGRVDHRRYDQCQSASQSGRCDQHADRSQPVCHRLALRMPYDVVAYPRVPTYVCAYSLQQLSLRAVAQALWGQLPFRGQLPVELPEA